MIDRVLPDHLAGSRLDQLELPGRTRLVAVTRAGVPRLDAAELVGQEGDLLHIAVQKESLTQVEALFALPQAQVAS